MREKLRNIYNNGNDILNGYPEIPTFTTTGGEILSEAFPIFYGEIKENGSHLGWATLALYNDLKAICLYTTLSNNK